MIRFNCPNCGRRYELADAMAHLPLLCKGCGQRLAVPDPTPDEPPLPDLELTPSLVPQPEDDRPYLIPEPEAPPDLHLDVAASPLAPLPPSPTPAIKPEPPTPPAASPRKFLPVVVDVAVGLILLAVGVLLGEMLAHQPTGQVLREAGSSARVPSTELLLWLAPILLLGLIYALLISRERTVGGWLKRRNPIA